MKIIKIFFLILMALVLGKNRGEAQNINWSSLRQEQRHILNVNAGFDYSFSYGFGYGYQLRTKLPTVLNLEHFQSMGENVLDDFRTKIGGQVRLYQINNFQFTAKIQGVFRRFEDDYVRLINFGSDLTGVAGYYKSRWFAAGEFGFDKAIITHFKHSEWSRENFPGVKNGWYQPATGGNFHYGVQAGFSFSNNDITLKIGKVVQQDFETNPTVPYYLQVGYNRRF